MAEPGLTRRELIAASAAVTGGSWLLAGCDRQSSAGTTESLRPLADFRHIAPEASRILTDPSATPTQFAEAPELARLVAQGKLPPVSERVGAEPIVIEPLHAIGRYGGTMRRAFIGNADTQGVMRIASGPDSLLYWDARWRTIVPNLARAFAFSDGDRVLTIELRRGMRWSDGAPFTADDVVFWAEMIHGDRRIVSQPSGILSIAGQPVRIEKIETHSFRFVSPVPYPALALFLASYSDLSGPGVQGRAGMGLFAPRHYISQFHPAFTSEETLMRQARAQGFANWALNLKNNNDWLLNPELPVLTPWKTTVPINQSEHVLERNPYSVWVDTAGNQLPYIDRIEHQLCAGPDAVNFKAAAGELDFQDRHLMVGKLPFLLSNRERSLYDIHLDPYEGCDLGIRFNLDYKADPLIGRLLADIRFRKAMSLASDREAINESFMLGSGIPSAAVPGPDNQYYPGEKWAQLYATKDLTEANRLLDSIGLTKRDRAGFRVRPDTGKRLRLPFHTVFQHFDYPAVAEMLRNQWHEVGLESDVHLLEGTLWLQRASAGDVAMTLFFSSADDPISFPDALFPFTPLGSAAMIGPALIDWFQSNGTKGKRPPPGIEAMMILWRQALQMRDELRIEAGKSLIRMHVENLVSVGLVSGGISLYAIRAANRRLGNVPRRIVNTGQVKSPANAMPMSFFYKDHAGSG